MKENNENKYLRVLYFIGIFLVVANHYGGGGVNLLYEWFPAYSFHLPLFMFCSGYLIYKSKDEKIFTFLIKNLKKFLIPLYFWNIVYGLFIILLHHKGFTMGEQFTLFNIFIKPIYNGHQFVFTLATWYIYPLLILKIINYLVQKIIKENKIGYIVYFILSLLIGAFGVHLAMKGYNNGAYLLLDKVMYFLPFFAFGMLYFRVLEKYDKLNNLIYFILVFAIALVVIYIFGGTKEYIPSWCNNFDNVYRPFIVGYIGILFWNRIAKILTPVLSDSKFVMTISRNTYDIVIHHLMGCFILNCIYYKLSNTLFRDFNTQAFKSEIFYYYLPKGLNNFLILYVIFGFAFPLIIIQIKKFIKGKIKSGKLTAQNI